MSVSSRGSKRIRLLGAPIDVVGCGDVLASALRRIRARGSTTILYVNVHCMNIYYGDVRYREILEAAEIVYCDGTGVALGAWLAGQDRLERMTGADWIHDLCRMCVQEKLSLYLLGGGPGTAVSASTTLTRLYPGLRIAGTAPGYDMGHDAIAAINRSRPDVLLVGMGTPKQEKWIALHRSALDVPVVWAVGALFDFVSGRLPRGPHWMTDHGLEWLCRLAVEPRKLWRRYLVGNPMFFLRVVRESWMSRQRD